VCTALAASMLRNWLAGWTATWHLVHMLDGSYVHGSYMACTKASALCACECICYRCSFCTMSSSTVQLWLPGAAYICCLYTGMPAHLLGCGVAAFMQTKTALLPATRCQFLTHFQSEKSVM
jgi:hypothetical protein